MATYDRWELKTVPQLNIGEIKFNPIQQPTDQSPSLAKSSAQESQERRRTYSEQRTKIDDSFTKIWQQLHHDAETNQWLANKKDEVQRRIKNFTAAGNYEGALNAAREAASGLLQDPEVMGRIQNNQEYQKALTDVEDRQKRGDITSDQLEYWKDINKFKSEYTYDDLGNITGTKSWEQSYTPSHKVDTTAFIKNVLSMLTPNTRSTENTTDTSTESTGIKGIKMSDVKGSGNLTTLSGVGALKQTTHTDRTSRSSSRQETELTSKRLIDGIIYNIKRNPDIERAYTEQFNIAQYMYKKYSRMANEAVANRDPNAEEYRRKVEMYKAQITTPNGDMIHDPQQFIIKSICNEAGNGLFNYNTIATTSSYLHHTGDGLSLSPESGTSGGKKSGGLGSLDYGNNGEDDEYTGNTKTATN